MALQGSIETFALPDVLRLLASTSKTGRLRMSGTRGSGKLWVADGKLVAGDTTTAPVTDPTSVVFELLRFHDGDFVFDQDETSSSPGDHTEVEGALSEAEAMLEEWKDLESVVPSLDAWVSLRPTLAGDDITIGAEQWRSVATVGSGMRAADFGAAASLGELDTMRQLRDLVELGVVEVGDAPSSAPPAAAEPAAPEVDEPDAEEPEPFASSVLDPEASTDAGSDEPEPGFEPFDPSGLVVEDAMETGNGSAAETVEAEPEGEPADEMDAADIARQLATLSPTAARAVAAAAKARTPEERDEALAGIPDEEGSLNRDLLLKFLGSVNS